MCDENTCVSARICVQSLTDHLLFFAEHLHTPLLGVMQETVVAQTNSSLSYWLTVSRGGN